MILNEFDMPFGGGGGSASEKPRAIAPRPTSVKIKTTPAIYLFLVFFVATVAALALFFDNQAAAAGSFVAIASGVVTGGFGVAIGERSGVSAAASQLGE